MTIFTLFFAVLVANVEFAGFTPKQKYTDCTVSMETVHTYREKTNQSTGICLGLSWPYNNIEYEKASFTYIVINML